MGEIRLSMTLRSFSAEEPASWEPMLDMAVAADEAGIDRLAVSDHVVFGEDLAAYGRPELGGQRGGKQPTGPDGHWLEPLTTLAVVAGRTRRVRLGTNILIAALRRPVVLAKTLSTLDVLSGGRVDLGVGVGWQREEYEAAGLDFAARGRLLDHTLEVLQAMWGNDRATYTSDELSFDGIHQMPKPLQPGGVPIWVSGTLNPRTINRLVRFGAGWIPWGDDALDVATSIDRMRMAVAAAGRSDAESIEVAGTLPVVRTDDGAIDVERTMDGVPALAAAGVTDMRLYTALPAERAAAVEALRPVVDAFRLAVGRPSVA